MAKTNVKAVMGDLEKLELLQAEAKVIKEVVGQAVHINKGPMENKNGKIQRIIIDRMKVKVMVLVDNRSTDDPLGTVMLGTRDYNYIDPIVAAKFGKKAGAAKDPASANKRAVNKAYYAVRDAMKAGKVIDPAILSGMNIAVAEWNKAPGAAVTHKTVKAKK